MGNKSRTSNMNYMIRKKFIDKVINKCYFVKVVNQFVHSRVTIVEIESCFMDLNSIGC